MQRAVEALIIAAFIISVGWAFLVIESLVEEAAERRRWGVVFLFSALLSPIVGLLTLAWILTH